MHHIKLEGIIFQTTLKSFQLNLLFKHTSSSTTRLGITLYTPNILKNQILQVSRIITVKKEVIRVSPCFLHIQHQSITMTWHCYLISIVGIFSKDVVNVKKAILKGVLDLRMLFKGKAWLSLILYPKIVAHQSCGFLLHLKTYLLIYMILVNSSRYSEL
jgi:hypothetical protein